MPVKRFTDLWLSKLKPSDKRVEFTDAASANIQLRLSTTGKKTFLVRFPRDESGKRVRRTLGDYPELSLADARRAAENENGQRRTSLGTTRDLFEEYVAAMRAEGKETAHDVERDRLGAGSAGRRRGCCPRQSRKIKRSSACEPTILVLTPSARRLMR